MRKIILLSCFVTSLFAHTGCKNSGNPENKKITAVKEKWHWGNPAKQSESAGYAQVVKTGNTLYISGIPTSDLSPEGVAKVYKALGDCLKAFGASSHSVVKETLYTTDIEAMKACNGPRRAFYQGDFPAATWVQISRLYEPSAKLEIELIAELTVSE